MPVTVTSPTTTTNERHVYLQYKMTSSPLSYYVALTLLFFSAFVTVNKAQQLSQENIESLREYLLRREELPSDDIAREQEDTVQQPIATQFSDIPEDADEQTSNEAVQIPAFNDEGDLTSVQRALKDRKNRRNSTKSGEARDKSITSIEREKFYGLKVVKAEKFRYGGNGPFYTEVGVVVTADDGSRFLIRRTKSNKAVRCWGSVDCDTVAVVSANQMTKNWELVATKETAESTVGDFIRSSQSVIGRNAAADAMMELD